MTTAPHEPRYALRDDGVGWSIVDFWTGELVQIDDRHSPMPLHEAEEVLMQLTCGAVFAS